MRMPRTCCRRELLILLIWLTLFRLSRDLQKSTDYWFKSGPSAYISLASGLGSYFLAPFIGWLADVKLGRYKVIIYGTLASFAASILFAVEPFIGAIFGKVLSCLAHAVDNISSTGFTAAMLPFMTDQLIGATADELSAVVYWFYWVGSLSFALAGSVLCSGYTFPLDVIAVLCAACLAMIIVSDCLCQQWLDRTHKITNPIKLIVQVLNYARKNRFPQRRSAFTYMDEEQPSRLDFGKEKFGGPFTEEEVEDVKTVIRLLPLVACLGISVGSVWEVLDLDAFDNYYINCVLSITVMHGLPPLLLIPIYQFLLYPLFHKWVPRMLRRINAGLFLHLVSFALCAVLGYTHSGDFTGYLTCTTLNTTETPNKLVEWYWKLAPQTLYGVAVSLLTVLMFEFAIAQSPDKMKGLVIGMLYAFMGISMGIQTVLNAFFRYTLCYDMPVLVLLTVLFLVFLYLSKHYTLRERNREVNIQAIVEEHYERYLDQEEEYMREHHY